MALSLARCQVSGALASKSELTLLPWRVPGHETGGLPCDEAAGVISWE